MAKTIAESTLGNYEFRAVEQKGGSLEIKVQQRELGAKRFATKVRMTREEWDSAVGLGGNVFWIMGLPLA